LIAAAKPIQDYSLDFVQNGEEAYRATVTISFGSRHFIVESPDVPT
jgi:hypothetical protein